MYIYLYIYIYIYVYIYIYNYMAWDCAERRPGSKRVGAARGAARVIDIMHRLDVMSVYML